AGSEMGVAKSGVNRLENGIPIGAIYQDLEFRAQGNDVAGTLESEIGYIGFPARGDGIQFPLKASCRTQNPGDAGEHAQVGAIERVLSTQRSIARLGGIPGSEGAEAVDLSRRSGIAEEAIILHRHTGPGRL